MNKENVIIKLQIAMYLLNFAAVCLVTGTMIFSIFETVDSMNASSFLESVYVRPWKPEMISVTALACYLLLVLCSSINYLWKTKKREIHFFIIVVEIIFCISATVAMNMNYDGLVLLIVADMIREQKGNMQKIVLGVAIIGLYTIVDYNLLGNYFGMIPWDTFLSNFNTSFQAILKGVKNIFTSMNLVLFILYMAMLLQREHNEREQIQILNSQLKFANLKLKAYAIAAEKNAETKERNRLAREIHDTLGHALTGIVAGIDACITMIDISPEATKKQLEKIGNVARQGITDVRRSVSKLRPDALEKMDLEKAISKMMEELKNTANIDIVFKNQVHPLKFLEDEEEVIYRVVQEATTNSVRHGHADKISIEISKKEEWLTIIVKDNGLGCKEVEEGFGLKHMKERLELLNGRLEYDGQDGFFIKASIPIRWGEEFN